MSEQEQNRCPKCESDRTNQIPHYPGSMYCRDCSHRFAEVSTLNHAEPLTDLQKRVVCAMNGATAVEGCSDSWHVAPDGMEVKTISIRRKKQPVWKVGDGFESHGVLYVLIDHDGTNWAYSRIDDKMDGLGYCSSIPNRHQRIPHAELLKLASERAEVSK